MEAAVLKPQMMADARAELEVQKLQELVRKLERQNEQLRTRAITVPPFACPRAASCCSPSPAPSRACRCFPEDEPFTYFQPHSAADEYEEEEEEEEDEEPRALLDELMLLDLETLSPSAESEETWLYVSPRSPRWSASPLSALQWSRRVLDQQRPELETLRHSLSVSRWSSGFSSPAYPRARVAGVSPLCTSSPFKPCTPVSSSGERAGRSCVLSQASVDSDVSASELDDDSAPLAYKLQDLTDVQVMARLQEESLRQALASSNNRRSSSFSFQLSQRSDSQLDEDEEDEDEEYGQLPPPQPRLSRAGLQRGLPHSHTFSSIREWTRSSSASMQTSPSSTVEPENKLRRSMPNLLSPALTSPSMRNSQSFESSSALTRLQTCIPAPAQLQTRAQSVGNFSSRPALKATAYVSPTIKSSSSVSQCLSGSGVSKAPTSQIPSRSGLPRPASFIVTSPRSKLSTPVRSLLTPPKSLATLSALRDGHWRDGCY